MGILVLYGTHNILRGGGAVPRSQRRLPDTSCSCTWLHLTDVRRSGERRGLTASDKRGVRQGDGEPGARQRSDDS